MYWPKLARARTTDNQSKPFHSHVASIAVNGAMANATANCCVVVFSLATLLAGTIFTEKIFGIQGIGLTALSSLTTGDLPVISATVIIAAAFIIAANLVVDLLYSVLDPRVRLM